MGATLPLCPQSRRGNVQAFIRLHGEYADTLVCVQLQDTYPNLTMLHEPLRQLLEYPVDTPVYAGA